VRGDSLLFSPELDRLLVSGRSQSSAVLPNQFPCHAYEQKFVRQIRYLRRATPYVRTFAPRPGAGDFSGIAYCLCAAL